MTGIQWAVAYFMLGMFGALMIAYAIVSTIHLSHIDERRRQDRQE